MPDCLATPATTPASWTRWPPPLVSGSPRRRMRSGACPKERMAGAKTATRHYPSAGYVPSPTPPTAHPASGVGLPGGLGDKSCPSPGTLSGGVGLWLADAACAAVIRKPGREVSGGNRAAQVVALDLRAAHLP